MLYFIFFITGALSLRFLQALFSISSGYTVFKFTEFYCITIMTEIEIWRRQALQILELCYSEADRDEEFGEVQAKIHEKYNILQQNILSFLKSKLPYQTNYSNLSEAVTVLLNKENKND